MLTAKVLKLSNFYNGVFWFSLSIYLSIFNVSLFLCFSVYLSIYLQCLSVSLCLCVSVYLALCLLATPLFICLSISLSLSLSLSLSVHEPGCLSFCLSVHHDPSPSRHGTSRGKGSSFFSFSLTFRSVGRSAAMEQCMFISAVPGM